MQKSPEGTDLPQGIEWSSRVLGCLFAEGDDGVRGKDGVHHTSPVACTPLDQSFQLAGELTLQDPRCLSHAQRQLRLSIFTAACKGVHGCHSPARTSAF